MSTEEEYWGHLIRGLRDGDRTVVQDFCQRYGASLERLAAKHLPAALRRRVGPEDVVQSACRTFLRRTRGGEFQLADSEDLWRLLCAITLTKVREQARFHLRQKRGLDKEVALEAFQDSLVTAFQPVARPNARRSRRVCRSIRENHQRAGRGRKASRGPQAARVHHPGDGPAHGLFGTHRSPDTQTSADAASGSLRSRLTMDREFTLVPCLDEAARRRFEAAWRTVTPSRSRACFRPKTIRSIQPHLKS